MYESGRGVYCLLCFRGSITVESGMSFSFFIIMCVVLISFVNGNRYVEVVRQSLFETSWEVAFPESAGTVIFFIRFTGNIFIQVTHKPADIV